MSLDKLAKLGDGSQATASSWGVQMRLCADFNAGPSKE